MPSIMSICLLTGNQRLFLFFAFRSHLSAESVVRDGSEAEVVVCTSILKVYVISNYIYNFVSNT